MSDVDLNAPEVKEAIASEAKKLFDKEAGGLKKKNEELMDELKGLQKKFDGIDPDEFKKLKSAKRNKEDQDADPVELRKRIEEEFAPKLTAAEKERDEALEQLRTNTIDTQLTSVLTEAGVAKEFLPAAKALLRSSKKVDVKDGGAIVDGAPVADFVKGWTATDGKAFLGAPDNKGGGAGGGGGGGAAQGKKASEMTNTEKSEFIREHGSEKWAEKVTTEQQKVK